MQVRGRDCFACWLPCAPPGLESPHCLQEDDKGGEGAGPSCWASLPAELLLELLPRVADGGDGGPSQLALAQAKTLLRGVCRDWWKALPIGEDCRANTAHLWPAGRAAPA